MLSDKIKIKTNLCNPIFGLFPMLALMLTDNFWGKNISYLIGGITACLLYFYRYFFEREKFVSWYVISFFVFYVLSFILYDYIDNEYKFIRSEILVASYFFLLFLLKNFIKKILLSGKNGYTLGFRENINTWFLLQKNILIFLLCYIFCYFVTKFLGTFNEFEKEIYQIIEWCVIFCIFLIASLQMYWNRMFFNDEKYVVIINNEEKVIGYESFNLLTSNKKLGKDKNRHIKLRIFAIYDGKLLLRNNKKGVWDLYYQDYLLYGENYDICLKRIIGENLYSNVKLDEKYIFETERESCLTFLHSIILTQENIANLDPVNYKLWTFNQLIQEIDSSILSPQLKRDLERHFVNMYS